MKKLLVLALAFGLSPLTYALPDDEQTAICVGVKHDAITFKTSCTFMSGGGGVLATDITFNGKTHHVIRDGSKDIESDTLDGKSYKTYLRDAQFKKTRDQSTKQYFCYQTKDRKLEFCVSGLS